MQSTSPSTPDTPFPFLSLAPDLQAHVILSLPDLDAVRQLLRTCTQLRALGASPQLQCRWLLTHRTHAHPMHLAAAAGSEQLVQCLLAQGQSPSDWRTPPPDAPSDHNYWRHILTSLNVRQAPMHIHDRLLRLHGHLPLHVAALHGNTAAAAALASAPGDAALVNSPLRNTPASDALYRLLPVSTRRCLPSTHTAALHLCILRGHVTAAACLLRLGADGNSCPGPPELPASPWDPVTRWPPLLHAVQANAIDMVRALLQGGADPSAVHDYRPMLHAAVWAGAVGAVRELLRQPGTDVNARGLGGSTALHLAARWTGEHRAVVQVEEGPVEVRGRIAAEMARALLSAGVDPDARMDDGCSALAVAAQHGCVELVEALAQGGASVGLRREPEGTTALHVAASQNRVAVARALVAAGADVDARAADGSTPLMAAVEGGHVECVEALLQAGADPDALRRGMCGGEGGEDGDWDDGGGGSALLDAAWHGDDDVLRALLRGGASPGLAGSDGRTALHLASHRGHVRCVRELLLAGAEPMLRCRKGQTAAQLARQHRRRDVLAVLQEAAGAEQLN